MANKTISELQRKTIAVDSDLLIIENSTTTNSITKGDLLEGYAKMTDLHSHWNMSLLDSLTQEMIDKWNNMLLEIEALKERVKKLEEAGVVMPPVVDPDPEPEIPPVVDPEPELPPVDPIGFANHIIYGYYMGYAHTVDPSNINIDEINEATTVMTKASVGKMDKTSICPDNLNGGFCPAGATFFIIVPDGVNLTVTKDNGIGGKVPYHEAYIEGQDVYKYGCNGVKATLNGVAVRVWGEFMTSDTQLYMYVE